MSVSALQTYYESAKPFLSQEELAPALTAQQQLHDLLDIEDVIGKRIINTRLHRNITIREENAITALEVMSRFAVDPKWLIYLPPTISPCETSKLDGLLEHPEEAFAYYLHEGVHKVVCQQKHIGSRAVVAVCRDADAGRKRFGIMEGEAGVCYTRTGRRFFNDAPLELEFLEKVRKAVEVAGIWEELKTDWICLDCELMPWSAKAQELLRQQYAPTGAAAHRNASLTLNPKPTFGFTSAANSELLPQLKPRAIREHFVVPSIGSSEVACAEWPNIRPFEHFL
jgi:protein phosphatase